MRKLDPWIEYYKSRPVTEADVVDGKLPWELYVEISGKIF